jgi:hypothetical protein
VALAVLLDAFLGVDHQHRRLGAGRARHHVLEELDVAGRVVDNVVALAGLEETAGGIDRDALGLFILEGVQKEGVLEGARIGDAHGLDLFQLAFGE